MTLDELYAALPRAEVATGRTGAVVWLRQHVQELSAALGRWPLVVEIGTWCGVTALALADVPALVVCVDTFEAHDEQMADRKLEIEKAGHTQLERFMANAFALACPSRLLTIIGESVRVARRFPQAFADIVFIDADHEYDAVVEDLAAWAVRVRPGGTLCGHDGNQKSVSMAVDEFLSRHGWPTAHGEKDCLWWTTRPHAAGPA